MAAGFALVLGVLTALLGASGAVAAPAVEVTVGGRPTTLTADRIAAEADVAGDNWGGPGGGVPGGDALSLRKVVELAGGDPARVRGLVLTGTDGRAVELDGGALEEPPPFGTGPAIPPLFWADGDGVHFARSAADGTLEDRIDVAGDGRLTLAVDGGATVAVTATADRRSARTRQTVRFVAEAPDAGEGATFRWRFGDGTTGEGREVRHRFDKTGSYDVTVTVTDGDREGTAEPVSVRVGRGKAKRAADPARSPGTKRTSTAPRSGVDRAPSSAGGDASNPSSTGPSAPPSRRSPGPRASERKAAAADRPAPAAKRPSPPTLRGELLDTSEPAATAAAARTTARPASGEDDALDPTVMSAGGAVVVLLSGAGVEAWRSRRRRIR
ncbi:PKD domain-containing protein [Patulibacter americanus]|uniref:PKD domain-containing protein n=1 Tax=Patulibacter americanus TaxID=588672 RepID=UPI0003B758E2|nr:PKD domain-containing protein [Patulibacter americanus]